MLAVQALAADPIWIGKPLSDYIDSLRMQGVRVIYSDDLVTPESLILAEPAAVPSVTALRVALRAHNLLLVAGPGENWLVVADPDAQVLDHADNVGATPASNAELLPEIVVSSSIYSIGYQNPGSHNFLDRDFASDLPDVGEEALRAIDRLPGVASGGISTRSHVRGGNSNEQLILLDGLRLYEPYHLKDFQAISSIINQSAIDGIDFYSAGYQARYGDRMSGVADISLRAKPSGTETELGLSLFNTSVMSAGRFLSDDSGDWLVSGRRSNLDLVSRAVKKGYGEPEFEDVLAHVGWQWSDRTYIAANFLYSRDRISLAQADETESAVARYRNNVGWLKMEFDWTDAVSVSTILSATDIANSRDGQVDIENTVSGTVVDSRDFSSFGIKQDWKFDFGGRWLFRTGFDVSFLDAEYDYDSVLNIFAPFDQIFDNQPFLQRNIQTNPEGEQYAAYAEARWKIHEDLIVDFGLRFDRQTYSVAGTNEQTSPRVNILYKLGSRTELRAAVGRFYQAQEINEVQINDGLAEFFPPQYADHFVASLAHDFSDDLEIRLELFRKNYNELIPRYENAFNALVLLPELQIDRTRIDASTAAVRGAEMTISGELNDDSSRWWLSYAWSVAEESIQREKVQRSWDQTHAVKFGAIRTWGRFKVSAAGSWHSGWPKTELIVEEFQNPDGSSGLVATTTPRNSLDHDPFFTLDLRASRDYRLRNSELTTFIEISNVLNRENACCTEYSMQMNEGGSSLLVTEAEHWLPLVPSIGVIWRF